MTSVAVSLGDALGAEDVDDVGGVLQIRLSDSLDLSDVYATS